MPQALNPWVMGCVWVRSKQQAFWDVDRLESFVSDGHIGLHAKD